MSVDDSGWSGTLFTSVPLHFDQLAQDGSFPARSRLRYEQEIVCDHLHGQRPWAVLQCHDLWCVLDVAL